MDSDIYGPSQQMMMGIDEKPYVNEANQIVPIERYGVKVMSLGFLMDVDQPVIWRGPMVMKAVEQFLQDVAWGALDFLVDRPAARDRRRPADADAEDPPLRRRHRDDAAGRLADRRAQGPGDVPEGQRPVLGIVENMSYFLCPQCGHREEIFKHGGGERTAEQLASRFSARSRSTRGSRSAATRGARSSRASRSPR